MHPDVVTKQQFESDQLKNNLAAYDAAHPGQDNTIAPIEQPTISEKKKEGPGEATLNNLKFGAKYLGSKFLGGLTEALGGIEHTRHVVNQMTGNQAGLAEDAVMKVGLPEIEKASNLGLSPNAGTNSRILSIAGDLTKLAPAIAGAESTGGATFYLQGVGAAAKQVDEMKSKGVKFDNHSDELFIQGSGIINYLLGKSVTGTVMSKMGTGFANDVVGSLSAEATKELANLGANATAEDVAKVYTGKALSFIQKAQQFGLGVLKSYPKIGVDFAGANLLQSGLKTGVNSMNDGHHPFGDVTGDEIAKDIISPFYNTDTPANGDLKQFALNLVSSPAAGLSLLHGATTAGMLFDKSPYKNAVIESLQRDSSPENVEKVKQQITEQGLKNQWTDDEIANTRSTVDALADIAGKLPSDLPAHKFNDATNLILGRRQLESVLKETVDRKAGLDPAIADKAGPFEALLRAKIEQANDRLDELITDKSYTYSEEGGKYYKTKLGEDPIEISKDRFDLEELENKSKPKEKRSEVLTEPVAEKAKGEKPKPAPEPKPSESPTAVEPVTAQPETSLMDDLDNELDNFKQGEDVSPSVTKSAETVIKKPESEIKPTETEIKPTKSENKAEKSNKEEPNDAIPIRKPETPNVGETSGDSSKMGGRESGAEEPAVSQKQSGKEVQGNDQENPRSTTAGNGLEKLHGRIESKSIQIENLEKTKADIIKANFKNKPDALKSIEAQISQSQQDLFELKGKLPYYVHLPEGHVETPGKPLPNKHGLDLFTHNLEEIGGHGYGVSEGSTGLSIGKGATLKGAIDAAEHTLSSKTPAEMQAIIKKKHDEGIQSPRGRNGVQPEAVADQSETEIANAKHIEDVIDKATATVGKAKAASGKSAEHARVVDEIDSSLENIDAALKLAGYYDTTGETEKDDHERGNLRPEKNFKADLVKYSKALAKELGYEHDTLIQGKKSTIQYATTNVPPAGGDGSVVLWKPNSKFGVYIKVNVNRDYPDDNLTVEKNVLWRVITTDNKNTSNRWTSADITSKDFAVMIRKAVDAEDRGNNPPPPEPEPTNEPPKDEKQERRKKYEQELKDAKAAFMKTFNKALSGINPETIEKGIKLLSVYAKIGIHDFKEIARELASELGEGFRDIFEGLKASYGAFATQEATEAQLDLMTDIREVRRATIEDFLTKDNINDTGSKHDTVDENSSAVVKGEPAGEPAGNVQKQPAKEVSVRQDGGSGQTGGKPEKSGNEPNGGGQSGSGNNTGTGEPGAGRGPGKPDTGTEVQRNTEKRVISPEDRNHVIKPSDVIVPAGAVGKFTANVDAIFLLKKLEAEKRNPSPADKQVLAQFVGWGGLAKYLSTPNRHDNSAVAAFVDGKRDNFYDSRYNRVTVDFTDRGPLDVSKYDSFNDLLNDARKSLANSGYSISPDDLRAPLLKALLSNEEYQAAQNSTINAHYTDRDVISKMWDIATKLGFKGGKVLESSAGVGHFFGLMPSELQGKTALQAYELDSITGRLLQKLYPQSSSTVTGFENSRVPQNSVDLAIGNVPFAASAPYDKNYPELSKFSMHNYFIAKNLKLLKPGGMAAIITSSSTMDSPSSAKFREWVTSPEGGNSYLVGAIRIPNNAFSENAGTQVTTDMLVFQKRGQVVNPELEQPFRYTRFLKTGKDDKGNEVDLHVNEYYHEHPEQMMGEMMTAHEAGSGGLYGSDNATLQAPENFNINKAMTKASEIFPKDIAGTVNQEPVEVKAEPITAIDKKEGSVFAKGGKIYKVTDGEGQPLDLDAKQKVIAKDYTDLKEGLLNLIQLEQSPVNAEANIDAQRKELNKDYDAFVKKHGNITGKNTGFLNDADIDFPIVASLENIARSIESSGGRDKIVSTVTKGEILNKRINFPRTEPTSAADIKDAINISLNFRTGLDINYMAKMLGEDVDAVRDRLLNDELAYENPDTGILETPEEYLSGYVRDKLKKAEIASVNDPKYLKNVAQLKKIIPEDIPSSLISYSLGSSWIPPHVYEGFAEHIFDGRIGVKYLDKAGKFLVTKRGAQYGAQATNTYAAGGMNGVDILEHTLNNSQIIVNDTIIDPDTGSKRTVKNPEKTAAAQAMQQQMQEEFEQYIRDNEDIQHETERIYNDIFNGQVLRDYRIPEFKHYPGASTTISLRQHQKRAVSRGLSESTLFAHEVGSGKAQPLDAKILTPNGYVLMGDIKPGDEVISVDGKATRVLAVYPQGPKEIFKVTFSDGSSTECCDEHLWLTQTYKERTSMVNEKRFGKDWPSCKPRVRSLNEIRHTLQGRLIGTNYAKNHTIPITQPVQFNEQPLVVHPYLMGVILGDGCVRAKGISFTSIDEEIINRVEEVLPNGFTLTQRAGKSNQSYHICKPQGKYSSLVQELKSEKVMGLLSYDKHIPEKYIFNSIECRLELLRGLLDTDGTVSKKSGSTIFYTTSEQLSKDVKLLVETLGGTSTVTTKTPKFVHRGESKTGHICYILHIKLPNNFMPFYLNRKAKLVQEKTKYPAVRYIVGVESVGVKEAQCIAVEHPSHLYLTDDCIVTHNTFTIITTAMEMRRLGTARKPLIGVQNSTLGDFIADFKKLYPAAKILAPTEKEMESAGRKRLFAKIATGDWDAIILPHSQITMIPDDPERQKAYIMEQIQEMKDTLATIDDKREKNKMENQIKQLTLEMDSIGSSSDEPATKKSGKSMAKSIGAKSLKIEAAMQKALDRKVDNIFNFEQLGIDALLMDEAHKYKRLGFQTAMKNIKGIDTSKSQRSQSILLKSRWIQEKTGGKNVNFYTGTPISNTMAEAWTMIKYLRPDILEHLGIQYFDQFAKTFGQVIPSLEQTGGGTFKVQSRFAKFQNLPEFITAFRAATDVVLTDDVKEFQNTDTIPKLKNGKFTQIVVDQSPELKAQIGEFKRTLEWFDKLTGKEKKEYSHIPLVVFNKAKQASIDLRLLDPDNVDSPMSKVNQVISNAYNIYKENKANKGVQMIFSDMYQSPEPKNKYLDEDGFVVNPSYGKERFNLFNDIKKKLVARGVPADEIVILTEPKYDNSIKKKALFNDANTGKIRFLLGTTEKMGVGVNAQQRLVALHHVDAPARPMDFEQRNGRILRQGNENKLVDVLAYGTDKTLDSSAFQRLSTKQKFINQIMKGQNLERVTEDPADEAQMTFDEMMAHLSDSPYAMQKLLVDNKLRSEHMKESNFKQKVLRSNRLLRDAESDLRKNKSKIAEQIKNAETVRQRFPDGNISSLNVHDMPEVTEKFSEAADAYVQKLIDKYYSSPTKHAKGGFELNGVRVELEVNNREKISKETSLVVDTPILTYTMPDVGIVGDSWDHNGYEIQSNSGTGLLSSVRSKLDNVLVRPSHTQTEINQNEKDIEQLKKDTTAKFDDTKLKELEAESEALKAKMIAEGNKPVPPDDNNPGGGQTPAEYIKDQSNIKPALDFLDKLKANPKGGFMSLIVPIPPAVWNGAIDVMKNILKATNSTQKAIRVAAKYIIDRGGTEAQAKDFEATMADKMANSKTGQRANAADTEDIMSEETMIKAAGELQGKLSGMELSPDEKTFAKADLKLLTKKELHRYIEVAAVLAVDSAGVPTSDVVDLMDRVNNRVNPKAGTAVPTGGGGSTPPPAGNEPMVTDDDEPRGRIPKKENLPMDSTENLPEQTDSDGKPEAKENYSAIGKFKDIRVRNLEQLKAYGQDMGDLSALRDVRKYATSKSQSSIIMKTATDRIIKAAGKEGWGLLRQALVESRLRGIKQRWINWSTQIKRSSDNEIDDLFEDGKLSLMYDILAKLDGYENDPKPEDTILGLITNEQYDDAREYMSDIFANAAENVAYYDKLSNGKTFDDMVKDGAFVDPKMQEAFEAYKSLLAKPFEESHAANEGVFSDALGPLDAYYPLVPVGKDKHFVVTPGTKYRAPDNPNNKFATGQGNQYSTALSDLSQRLSNAIRTSNKANAIKSLETAGLIAKVTKDSPDTGYISVNGETYTATKALVQDSRLLTQNGKTVSLPARYVLMPTWLYKEIKPIFEDSGSLKDDFSLFGRINNVGIKLMLGGPMEATSHSYRLLGGIVNSMPYMQEWAYKNGVLGHAGGLVLNNPFVKTFAGMGQILFSDISSDEALATIQEMAKLGVIPEKTWQKTWSKEFAELTGAKKVPVWDFSPILYGKHSIDLKARVLLYRLTKAMNPSATPEQVVTMQNELGNYTMALQGELEKFVKRHGLAPFYSFGGAIYRSGIKSVFGASSLPLTRPSLKEAFTTKLGAEQMSKLALYKMAQLLTAGIVGLTAAWALTYHAQTDKWPWEDKHSKLLKIPFPEDAKNDISKKLFYDKKSKTWNDVDFSFFNPFINRGIRAVGAPKAYETKMLGGTAGQAAEAGTIQAINTNLSPYTSSPAIQLGVTALTGDAPYITGIRDKYSGTPGIGFYRKVNTFSPGMQIPANLAVGALGLNPIVDYAFSPLTKSLRYKYSAEDADGYSAALSVFNTIIPHLMSPHGSDENKEKMIKKQAKAINTSIKKEEDKQKK